MTILDTTTVTITRPPAKVDAQDPATYTTVTTLVPGRVSTVSASESGGRESATAKLLVGVDVDVRRQDRIIDEVTGDIWDVGGVRTHVGLGLDYLSAELTRSAGSA